jgi:hypothetical protein
VKNLFKIMDVSYAGDILVKGVDAKGDILKHPEALEKAYRAGQAFAADESGPVTVPDN